MIGTPDADARRFDEHAPRIDRARSPLLAAALPWASVALLSLLGAATVIASAPLLPPLAFMALIAWRQLRPGMLPIWAGLPLGAIDDLYSGQPFGSAILLWSCTMLALEVADVRLSWRGFFQHWLEAAALISLYLVATCALAALAGAPFDPMALTPQLVLSLVSQPLVARLVAELDRLRLLPLRRPS
ncbi:MAG: rod shape-determining protein MreD [Novosphingobium sp.]